MTVDRNPERVTPASVSDMPYHSWSPLPRTMALFVLAGLLVVGQMYVVLPMLEEMGASFGTRSSTMAAAATVFGLAYSFGFLCAGPLAGHFGQRNLIVAGLLSSGLLTIGVALAPEPSALLCVRIVQGFCSAMFLPSALSYVASHIRPESRVLMISCVTTSAFAAAVAMQAIAQLTVNSLGWRGVFVLSGASISVLGVLARIVLLKTVGSSGQSLLQSFRLIPKLLVRPDLLALYLGSFLLLGGFVAVYVAITLSGPEQVKGSQQALFALRISGLPAMIAVPLLAPMLRRYPAFGRVVFGFCVSALAAVMAAFVSTSVLQLALVLLVFVAAAVMTAPALVELIGSNAGVGNGGVATALYGFAMFFGGSVGGQLVGQFDQMSFEMLLFSIAAALMVGAALTVVSRAVSK